MILYLSRILNLLFSQPPTQIVTNTLMVYGDDTLMLSNKHTHLLILPYCFMTDIGLLVEGDDGDNDGLGLDVSQVGLRKHPHSLAAAVLGEDERVAAQTHGARLETVPVHADGLLTGLT